MECKKPPGFRVANKIRGLHVYQHDPNRAGMVF